jgi:hypothetical protein
MNASKATSHLPASHADASNDGGASLHAHEEEAVTVSNLPDTDVSMQESQQATQEIDYKKADPDELSQLGHEALIKETSSFYGIFLQLSTKRTAV